MGQSPSAQNQQSSGSPSGGPLNFQAEQIRNLQAALAQASTNESNLKNEIETLKTSLTHALSSEREMRASARDTREEWERVERALRQEIGVLNKELSNTHKELTKVKKELKGKKVIPFVQRFIQGHGSLVEEMITLEEPSRNASANAEVEEELLEGSSGVHVLFDGLALHHLEKIDSFAVPDTSPSAFKAKLAPELAALERATAGLQQAVNAELRSAHARASSTGPSAFIPKTARNLRLLVVLWEASGIEQLMNTLMSVVGERSPKVDSGDCLICTEPLTREETVSVEGCGHATCKDCLREHINAKLGEKVWPILCPICVADGGSGKAQVITRLLVDELALPPVVLNQWTDFELSQFVVPVTCLRCNKPNLFELLDYNRSKILICTHGCECAWCRDCSRRVNIETPHDCGDAALDALAGDRRWMRCPRPSCRVMVEKNVGCNHITCRCGMHFCYRCGQDITGRVSLHVCPRQT